MGHGPPYVAVITLSAVTAYHWRSLRYRLASNGILDPMMLPTLHALLDFTEAQALEGAGNTGDPKKDARARQQFYDKLYAPESIEAKGINGAGYKPTPTGFDDPDDIEASFDAFAKAASGSQATL